MLPAWEISVPRVTRLPGVRMAGFSGRTAEPVELAVVPFPSVSLFLDLGDAVVLGASERVLASGGAVIGVGAAGLRGLATELDCVQVRLSPLLAYAVLGGAVADLAEDVVELDDVWGAGAERLRTLLHTQQDWDDRFALVEAELVRRCQSGARVEPEVAQVWRRMTATHGRSRVSRLAERVDWSRQRLWQGFRNQLGITPKRAAELIRFDHAAHLLAGGRSPALVAADAGYADQSHLHRDAAAFAGLTPSGVAAAAWLQADPVAWPGPISRSHERVRSGG